MKLDSQVALADKSLLLLDFDGPVCSVFAGYPASQIAAELVANLRAISPHLAEVLAGEQDPMEVLRTAAGVLPREQVEGIDDQLGRAELKAVESAEPTAGMAELIATARNAGLSVAIVSNNSAAPIAKYLNDHSLDGAVDAVVGRPFGLPERMKPDPYLLAEALGTFSVDASRACFIGDSVTDIEAGRTAGVMTIGYANKPGKASRLGEAGADVVVDAF